MTTHQSVLVRLSMPAHRAWLDHRAKAENRSLNRTIIELIEQAAKADPLRIVIRHCRMLGQEFYAVAVGNSADDFFEGADREGAVAAAQAKAKEFGLSRTAIEFRTEFEGETA